MKTFDRIFIHLMTFFGGAATGVMESWIFTAFMLIATSSLAALITATHK